LTPFTRTFSSIPAALFLFASAGALIPCLPAQAQQSAARTDSSPGLGLTPAQRARAEARQAQFQKDVAALRSDSKLTNAQKQAKYTSLYSAMDKDMLALLSPAQKTRVMKQREINEQFQKDVTALQNNKSLTDAQKKARYVQIVKTARDASLALLTPAERVQALKRSAEAQQIQQQQAAKVAQARALGQQLQKSETPAQSEKLRTIALTTGSKIQDIIADKTMTDAAKTSRIVALRKDALSRDLALLTPAQRSLYERVQTLITAPSGTR